MVETKKNVNAEVQVQYIHTDYNSIVIFSKIQTWQFHHNELQQETASEHVQ